MTIGNFKIYSQYYDLLYNDKDYQAEVDYIYKLIEAYAGVKVNSILDLGSGTGKHGRLLAQKGLNVTGVEKSSEMVAIANKQHCANFISYVGDITDFSLKNKFCAVTSLFHVISYIGTNDRLDKLFSNVHDHLNQEGLFIFDVWYSPAVYSLKPETRIKRIVSENIELTRIAEPVLHHNKNIVDVNYHIFIKDIISGQIQDFTELHPMRHFSIPEVSYLADRHNYEILQTEEFITGETPSNKTWGITFIMRKK
jgi:SAM-dependent methyltransferase